MNISVQISESWYERASCYLADCEDISLLQEGDETQELAEEGQRLHLAVVAHLDNYLKEEAHDLVYAVVQAYLSKQERG